MPVPSVAVTSRQRAGQTLAEVFPKFASLPQSKALRFVEPNAALLDYMLPDGNGVELGVEFLQAAPDALVIVMTGTILPAEEEALCEEHSFPVLRKPFLASDVMNQIRGRLSGAGAAGRG